MPSRPAASEYLPNPKSPAGDKVGMSDALLIPMAVATGAVVIVVAIAVVLVVLIVTLSMRGRQRRSAKQRGETRQELADAHERAERAERDRDTAQEQAEQRTDPDR
jgi:flagellar biosynthesis/type III secretory pathway M-ring protein FliF/YscJ